MTSFQEPFNFLDGAYLPVVHNQSYGSDDSPLARMPSGSSCVRNNPTPQAHLAQEETSIH